MEDLSNQVKEAVKSAGGSARQQEHVSAEVKPTEHRRARRFIGDLLVRAGMDSTQMRIHQGHMPQSRRGYFYRTAPGRLYDYRVRTP